MKRLWSWPTDNCIYRQKKMAIILLQAYFGQMHYVRRICVYTNVYLSTYWTREQKRLEWQDLVSTANTRYMHSPPRSSRPIALMCNTFTLMHN